MVFVENIGDKYNGHEPDAFDLFKDCHYSKKMKGYTPAVQAAIAQMVPSQNKWFLVRSCSDTNFIWN